MTVSQLKLRTAELHAYINGLPAGKQESARKLLLQRLDDCGPDGEVLHWYPDFNGMVCIKVFRLGKILCRGYSGRRSKADFSRITTDMAQLDSELSAWLSYHRQREAQVAAERAKRKAWQHNLQLGDVLVAKWGYEQTNVDYYQVTGFAGKNMVELRKIDREVHYDSPNHGTCVPIPDCFVSEEVLVKRVKLFNPLDSSCCVVLSECETAFATKPAIVNSRKVYSSDMWTSNY